MSDVTIVVTGIGGNVGQGVARILRDLDPTLRIVGTNTHQVSGGNHLCDVVVRVPLATAPDFKTCFLQLVREYAPAMVIPCTDYEAYVLATLAQDLPALGVSGPREAALFLDKWKTFEAFSAAGLPFARSVLPFAYDGSFESVIVKPREGRGSRDLHLNPDHPELFDDTYVIQELLTGDELTIAAYVTGVGQLHGFIVMRRFLSAGATTACRTVASRDVEVRDLLEKLIHAIPVRGSFNVQAILGRDGSIVPFEVNGRVSGTASIRHHFGFRDVEYLLSEFVWRKPLSPVRVEPGSAVRYLADVIYPGLDLEAPRDRATRHLLF